MQPNSGFDVAPVCGELSLNIRRFFDPIIYVNPHNDVSIFGHDAHLSLNRMAKSI
jgi:hypothetical protein